MGTTCVTREQIQIARKADLYSYLLCKYPDYVAGAGVNLLHLREHDSVYVKRGVSGYHAFSSGEHGNPIDFLLHYLHFSSFVEAVMELCAFETGEKNRSPASCVLSPPASSSPSPSPSVRPMTIPVPDRPPFLRIFRYLMRRGFPKDFLDLLVRRGILYQEAATGNAVFISPQRDYCELRGTGGKPFHGVRKTSSNRFWYWKEQLLGHAEAAFITEGAIDALSLYLLHRRTGHSLPYVYIAIGGVANQKTIDRIQKQIPAVLAVDNDSAGEACRNRNSTLPFILPRNKDWNEDLCDDFPVSELEKYVIPAFLR